jgi:hypothetical protein
MRVRKAAIGTSALVAIATIAGAYSVIHHAADPIVPMASGYLEEHSSSTQQARRGTRRVVKGAEYGQDR